MARTRRSSRGDTADQILDVAERLVQQRGFNGFSYADVASELDMTKPALHYHFAGKGELGRALVDRYANRFADALETIDATKTTAPNKLAAYANLYATVLRDDRMCLCGMLAAEYQTLPVEMREAVMRFFVHNETWLIAVVEAGKEAGQLRTTGSAADVARLIIGGLEGAMLVARLRDAPDHLDSTIHQLLGALAGSGAR
jgi:TetR/AcrR family transcriptional repressor of nem operon